MNAAANLKRQMLEWLAERPRDHTEVMEAWRTSCPRLSIWEDACAEDLIDYEVGTGKVTLSSSGRAFLALLRSCASDSRPLARLALDEPTTLACMHGSAWRGNGGALVRSLAAALNS